MSHHRFDNKYTANEKVKDMKTFYRHSFFRYKRMRDAEECMTELESSILH